MPRKRIIDTEELYFDTELFTLLKERGLHLYIRLWGLAEDWGGYAPKYSDIALRMGALKFTTKQVEDYISKLLNNRKIIQYEVNGRKIHWIVNFLKHQKLDNPSPPTLPLPEWISCELCEYKSRKKYAKYTIIPEKLPVDYQSTTSKRETETVTETKRNRKETILSGKPDLEEPILYLNEKTKQNFSPKNKSNQDLVKARYNEGRTLDDFKKVIDKKVVKWLNDDKMMQYLRPSTLFNRTHFEEYLNEPKHDPMAKYFKKEA